MFHIKLTARDFLFLAFLVICIIIFALHYRAFVGFGSDNIINIEVKDGMSKEVVFKELSLAPGQSCEYKMVLNREKKIAYDLTFEFEEAENLDLKEYVYVKMETKGEVFFEKLLADAFKEGTFKLFVEAGEAGEDDIMITYYLPAEIGNEAQNAKSVFKLLVTAESVQEGEAK